MKKIILVAALVLGFAFAASAQPRAVGLRGGALSYQHTLGSNFAEVDLSFGGGLGLQATYNTSFYKPEWTKKGTWNAYYGYGAAAYMYGSVIGLGAVGNVGLEYTFWFPLQLSLDIRPQVAFYTGGLGLNVTGFYPAFGVRYKF